MNEKEFDDSEILREISGTSSYKTEMNDIIFHQLKNENISSQYSFSPMIESDKISSLSNESLEFLPE